MGRGSRVIGVLLVGGALLAATPSAATPVDGGGDVHAALRAAAKDVQLVVLKDGCDGECQAAAVDGLTARGCDQVQLFSEVGMVSAHCVPTSVTQTEGGVVDLSGVPGVESSVPDEVFTVVSPPPSEGEAPVTQQVSQFWGLDRVNQFALPLDGSSTTECFPKRGAGVTVYVLDTGINAGHSQFGDRASAVVPPGLPFTSAADGEGHGSHVAGTVAGETCGVAPKATIVGVKCLNDEGGGRVIDVVAAMNYVAGKKRANPKAKIVVNASLGSDKPASAPWTVAANRAAATGLVFVVAGGNDGLSSCRYNPAKAKGAISVAALGRDDKLASFSSDGNCTAVSSPGVRIVSVKGTGSALGALSGTSMASPHVAGLAALVLAEAPNGASLGRDEVLDLITEGAPQRGGYPMAWAKTTC